MQRAFYVPSCQKVIQINHDTATLQFSQNSLVRTRYPHAQHSMRVFL
jgi:hypothetical protein